MIYLLSSFVLHFIHQPYFFLVFLKLILSTFTIKTKGELMAKLRTDVQLPTDGYCYMPMMMMMMMMMIMMMVMMMMMVKVILDE